MKTKVSVVVPAYNEENTIASCLDCLQKQTRLPDEIIVVDNNSTDNTTDIVSKYSDVTLVCEPKQGRGAARKKGFEVATGDIILSTDADACVPSNWIELFEKDLTEKSIVAITGSTVIDDCHPIQNMIFNLLHPPLMWLYRLLFGHHLLCGFSFGILHDAYTKAGGFHPDIDGQEDVDLSARVHKVGQIRYHPHVIVKFSGRRFQRGLLRGYMDYFKAFWSITLRKRHHNRLSNER